MSLHDIWRGDVMPLSGIAVAIGRNSFDPPAPVVPVFDIHLRTLVFHDSGTPVHSGIMTYDALRGVLNFQPSNSGAQAVVTAVYFDAYDGVGGSGITTAATTLPIATTRLNSHPEVFVLNTLDSELQINMSGIYSFEYRASADNATTTRSSIEWWLERKAPGGLFAAVPGSNSYSYHRTTANGEDTANARMILAAIAVGDKFRVRGIILGGATTLPTVINGSSLTVRKLG